MRHRKIKAGILGGISIAAIWLALLVHRAHLRCSAQNVVFKDQISHLRTDAEHQLHIGSAKSEVTSFFENHGIVVSFFAGEASGSKRAIACGPVACGDAAIVHVSVRVDAGGAVIAPPEVSGIYTDCL